MGNGSPLKSVAMPPASVRISIPAEKSQGERKGSQKASASPQAIEQIESAAEPMRRMSPKCIDRP